MNKKGFSFIELLAVIVIIGIVIGVGIPTIRYADKRFHEKAYNTKVDLIKNAAKEYGDDFKEIIISGNSTYTDTNSGNSYKSVTITVRDLLNNGYITKDNGLKEDDVLDPRNDQSMLDDIIIIYIKNDRAYVVYNS